MKSQLYDTFESVRVINLQRRPRNLELFFERLPADWPFRRPIPFAAIDGRITPPPKWWTCGEGAWGCYRSHLAIIEECLNQDIDSVLIMEDDASFVDDFTQKVKEYIAHLPDDWGFAYIGGQHIEYDQRLPRRVNEWVYKPFNVNRTHCHGFRGRKMLELVYRHLNDFPGWTGAHHVDFRLGELHKVMAGGLYAPRAWLSGQIARVADANQGGASDINFGEWPALMPAGAEDLLNPEVDLKFVAVLGPFGGGANLLAGLVHFLGIPMSGSFQDTEKPPIEWQFESPTLGHLCRLAFEEPWLVEAATVEDRRNLLRRWAGDRCWESRATSRFVGGYHPTLCMMVPEMLQAWNDPLILTIDRPIDEAIDQVNHGKIFRWPEPAVRYTLPMMVDRRNAALAKHAPRQEQISYHRMIAHPMEVINQICRALDYIPTDEQVAAALTYISQALEGLPTLAAPLGDAPEKPFLSNRALVAWPVEDAALTMEDATDIPIRPEPAQPIRAAEPTAHHPVVAFVGSDSDGVELITELAARLGVRRDLPSSAEDLPSWLADRRKAANDDGSVLGVAPITVLGPIRDLCLDQLYVVHCVPAGDAALGDPTRRCDVDNAAFGEGGLNVLELEPGSLADDASFQTRRLADFLPIAVSEAQIEEAIRWVEGQSPARTPVTDLAAVPIFP